MLFLTWVKSPKQITDVYLCELATGNGAIPATLDESIVDSLVIPK
jgi:hypothetical protein